VPSEGVTVGAAKPVFTVTEGVLDCTVTGVEA